MRIRYIILLIALLAAGLPPAVAQVSVEPLHDTVDRTLESRLPPLEQRLGQTVEETVRDGSEPLADSPVDPAQTLPAESLDESLDEVGSTAGKAVSQTGAALKAAGGMLRPFVADVDPHGHAVEKNVLVVLVDSGQLAAVRSAGLDVILEREMGNLGLTLVTLRADSGYGLAGKALELRQAIPGASVDFNHLYRFQAGDSPAATANSGDEAGDEAGARPAARGKLRIGLVDSAIEPRHNALAEVDTVSEDFVSHEAERPLGHGTAIASLLAGATDRPTEIYAASVFFRVPGHAPGASTESLVAALDWLAANDVQAINMSLAGPPNALLERAIGALASGGGPTVVAAVGNNGPSGEPLYPGAYPEVIGVTAVDRGQKPFRYANRGEHVDFAALGVNVKVAVAGGSWRIESGTSMASPLVAAIVAELCNDAGLRGAEVRASLITAARDLGKPGFDPVFGHGLLTEPPAVASRLATPSQN